MSKLEVLQYMKENKGKWLNIHEISVPVSLQAKRKNLSRLVSDCILDCRDYWIKNRHFVEYRY